MSELTVLDTGDASEEVLDDMLLTQAFARQAQLSLMVSGIAKRLYLARTLYIGGQALAWHELTGRQRYGYFTEAETLIKGEDDPRREQWITAYQARHQGPKGAA